MVYKILFGGFVTLSTKLPDFLFFAGPERQRLLLQSPSNNPAFIYSGVSLAKFAHFLSSCVLLLLFFLLVQHAGHFVPTRKHLQSLTKGGGFY